MQLGCPSRIQLALFLNGLVLCVFVRYKRMCKQRTKSCEGKTKIDRTKIMIEEEKLIRVKIMVFHSPSWQPTDFQKFREESKVHIRVQYM